MESLDYDDIELVEDPFLSFWTHPSNMRKKLNYQSDARKFSIRRVPNIPESKSNNIEKIKDLNVDVPPLLAGWHLLLRAGILRWIFPQVKSMYKGELTTEKISRTLTRIFGNNNTLSIKNIIFKHNIYMLEL